MPSDTATLAPSGYPSIMVVMDRSAQAGNRAKLATALADRFSARLIGVAAQPIAVPPMYYEVPVSGIESEVELEEKRVTRELAGAEATFRSIAGSRTHVEWRQAYGFATEFAIHQSRAAALVVASRPVPGESLGTMSVNAGDLVMGAGLPVLFVPPGTNDLLAQRVVIAWKNTREARRAVTDALPFIRLARAATVVCVGDDSGSEDVRGYLADHGVLTSKTSLPDTGTSPAEALSHFAEQEAADLIVCGAYGHSRTREWVFGGVTRDLLNHARICCLMSH